MDIPRRGLERVTRLWSGAGELYQALATSSEGDRTWSAQDIRRRANRVVFEHLRTSLGRLPTRAETWLDALPAESFVQRHDSPDPLSGVRWTETFLRGWPPRYFVVAPRSRAADELLVTALRWLTLELERITTDVEQVAPEALFSVRGQLSALWRVSSLPPLSHSEPILPGSADINAIRSEGRPWSNFADLSKDLKRFALADPVQIAERAIWPDPTLRGRLFHLAVFGELLVALEAMGCVLRSRRPLNAAVRTGPAYEVSDSFGRVWDLWFEAAGIWSELAVASPYVEATGDSSSRALGADIVLVRRAEDSVDRALVIECKYSSDPSYVFRNGYEQVVTYATELGSRFPLEAQIAAVIGPESVVAVDSRTQMSFGEVGVAAPRGMLRLVRSVLSAD